MEKLNTDYFPPAIVRHFVDAFRHCWFTQYRDKYEPYRYLNYEDLKCILREPSSPEIAIVKNYMLAYVNSEYKETILSLYDETCNAYKELYEISPKAKIERKIDISFFYCTPDKSPKPIVQNNIRKNNNESNKYNGIIRIASSTPLHTFTLLTLTR